MISDDKRRKLAANLRSLDDEAKVLIVEQMHKLTYVETIDKIEAVIDGLPAREAFLLGQVIRYADRAGLKDEPEVDLGKANNYAHRLVTKRWRDVDGR